MIEEPRYSCFVLGWNRPNRKKRNKAKKGKSHLVPKPFRFCSPSYQTLLKQNKRLIRQNQKLGNKLRHNKPRFGNMESLLDDIDQEEVSKPRVDNCVEVHVKEAQQLINAFLDDIITNTYAFIQLKPDLPQWRNKDKLFDIGIINRETHHQAH
jgi:hypothetical protein